VGAARDWAPAPPAAGSAARKQSSGSARIAAVASPEADATSATPTSGSAAGPGDSTASIERQLAMGKLHPRSGRVIGFRPVVVDARTCHGPEDLVDLVLASSATPPFTSIGRHRGRTLLDGGMVDNAPAFVAEQSPDVARNLVLLTRPYPAESVGWKGTRLYLCPSGPVPINRWDYTSVERVDATVSLGRADAERYSDELGKFLEIVD